MTYILKKVVYIFSNVSSIMASRVNILDPGFVKATPQNLPVLKVMCIIEYIQSSENHVAAEFRNKKLER